MKPVIRAIQHRWEGPCGYQGEFTLPVPNRVEVVETATLSARLESSLAVLLSEPHFAVVSHSGLTGTLPSE